MNNIYEHNELYKRKHITTLVCEECGKIKRYVEDI